MVPFYVTGRVGKTPATGRHCRAHRTSITYLKASRRSSILYMNKSGGGARKGMQGALLDVLPAARLSQGRRPGSLNGSVKPQSTEVYNCFMIIHLYGTLCSSTQVVPYFTLSFLQQVLFVGSLLRKTRVMIYIRGNKTRTNDRTSLPPQPEQRSHRACAAC